MQKNITKRLAIFSLMLVIGLTSFGLAASAKSVAKTKTAKTKMIKAHKRTLPGKVTAINGATITMKKGNQSYTINAAGVTPVDRKGTAIAISDIKIGHKISVRGTVTGTAVSDILKLRDITLPLSANK